MSFEAARGMLAAFEEDDRERVARSTSTDAATVAAQAAARALEEDGGLVAYAERLARRREKRAAPMHHLAPIAHQCEEAERAMRGERPPVYAVMHAAVQHGKTSLLQADILRTLRRNPRARIGYASYAADIAEERMWKCRELAAGEGIHVHPTFAKKNLWHTIEGGYVYAGGLVGGQWTGRPFDKLYIDDPYSGPEQADSAAYRAKVEAAVDQKILTRGYETMSVLLNTARWGPNDISAFFIRAGWPYTCLSAIRTDEFGIEHALWPDVVPLDALRAIRDGRPAKDGNPAIRARPRRTWNALYQGRPVADGAQVFNPAHLKKYDRLPEGEAFYETIGIDAAYGAKARNDRSAAVCWRRYASDPRGLWLVTGPLLATWIGHETIELFACRVAATQIARAGGVRLALPGAMTGLDAWQAEMRQHARDLRAVTLWYPSGTEAGGVSVLRTHGAEVHTVTAGIDKLARAQGGYVDPSLGGYTSTWNEGHVHWPEQEDEHATAIRIQHEDFTGAPSDDDDGVDAAVSGHDAAQLLELTEMRAAEDRRQRDARTRAMASASSRHELGPAGRAPRV